MIFFSVSIGTYMAALDSSIINISMPTITQSFNSDMATTNWVITVYLLTLSGLLLIFGKLSDMVSRKKVYTLGMLVFTVSSLTCGLSGSLVTLIISRFFQATGGAMIMSNSPAIITETFPFKERGKALGTIGTVVALGIMTGAPLGGKIVSVLTWRYIFFINVPIGIFGIVLSLILLEDKKSEDTKRESFDFLGALFLMIFMVTFLLGLNLGARGSFGQSNVQLLFLISITFFVLFIVTELKVSSPTIELHLFKNAGFSSTNLSAMISYMTIFMVIFMIPFFLHRVKGLRPDIIGAILVTPTVMLFIFSPIFGQMSDKIGHKLLRCSGLSIMTVSFYFMSHITESTSVLNIIFMLLTYGFGIGMFTPPNNSLLMSSVPRDKLGIAAGMLATTRNMGMMMGVAAASAIFTRRASHYSLIKMIDLAEAKKLAQPYSDVFTVSAFICCIGVIIAFFQGRKNDETG